MWTVGSICQVLFESGVAPIYGNMLICSDVDGRGDAIANPGTGLPAIDTHFKEAGHIMQSGVASANTLALCCIHFN